APSEDLHDLLEELVARIEVLPLLVAGITSVLADRDNSVDGQPISPTHQGFGNGRIDLQPRMALFAFPTEVSVGLLVHVQRDDIDARAMMPVLPAIAVEEAI